MSAEADPAAALEFIQDEQRAGEVHGKKAAEVGAYAVDVLRSKGEIAFTTWGLYGGTPGLIGSANEGILIAQATPPVAVDGAHVALRDTSKEPHQVQLVRTATDGANARNLRDLYNGQVLASFVPKFEIPGVKNIDEQHLDKLHLLIQLIDETLEPLEIVPDLPRIAHNFEDIPRDATVNIRENPERIRLTGKRVNTNFSVKRPLTE